MNAQMLRDLDACDGGVEPFTNVFGEADVPVTAANVRRAVDGGCSLGWLLCADGEEEDTGAYGDELYKAANRHFHDRAQRNAWFRDNAALVARQIRRVIRSTGRLA